MNATPPWRSGKDEHDENFPVASILVAKRHRPAIMAFYRFARAADDAADHPTLAPDEKLAILDRMDATLRGEGNAPDALPLRAQLAARDMPPTHAHDLVAAFRQDVTKTRYATFAELMDYCALSAMPVGRFVLDVHGESRTTWLASDALCAALQIINHLQDCADDYRALDRIYIPQDIMGRNGAGDTDLAGARATDGLLAALREVGGRTATLLAESARLAHTVADGRLRMEIAVIQQLAERNLGRLMRRDPLADRVHLSRPHMAATALAAVIRHGFARLTAPRAPEGKF